jgi:hypothetical protein
MKHLARRNPTDHVPSPAAIAEVTLRLAAWAKTMLPRGTVRDVAGWIRPARPGWSPRAAFAFLGPPFALQRAFGFDFEKAPMVNHGDRLGATLARALGLDPGRRLETGEIGLYQFLDGLEHMLKHVPALGLDPDIDTLDATVIPAPGYPWQGPGTRFFSAAGRRWVEPPPPPWQGPDAEVEDHETGRMVKSPTVDWCQLSPVIEAPTGGWGHARLKGRSVLVTHVFDLAPGTLPGAATAGDVARAISRCGGLLRPSLAVGPIPATNFGPAVLVADPMLVLRALKPYRRPRTRYPVALYSTDVWTDTVGALQRSKGAHAWQELTGQTDAWYWMNPATGFEITGSLTGSGPQDATEIDRTTMLARVLGQRFRRWRPDLGFDRFVAINEAILGEETQRDEATGRFGFTTASDRYAYLEAKADGIVPLAAFTAAVLPTRAGSGFARFLKDAGFRGRILPIDLDDEERAVFFPGRGRAREEHRDDYVRYRYGWRVAALVARMLPAMDMM